MQWGEFVGPYLPGHAVAVVYLPKKYIINNSYCHFCCCHNSTTIYCAKLLSPDHSGGRFR